MTPPPFEPSDALVEQVAGYFSGALPYLSAVTHRNLAVSVLRVCGPAIGEEIIRQRVAKLSPDGGFLRYLNLPISITRTDDGTIATAGLTAHDLLRALGVAP